MGLCYTFNADPNNLLYSHDTGNAINMLHYDLLLIVFLPSYQNTIYVSLGISKPATFSKTGSSVSFFGFEMHYEMHFWDAWR